MQCPQCRGKKEEAMNQAPPKLSVAFFQESGAAALIVNLTASTAKAMRQEARARKSGLRLLDVVGFVNQNGNGGRSNARLGQLLADIETEDPELLADVCDLVASVYAAGRRGKRFKRTRR